jgi:membrane-associated phospholipid phosphatase
LVVLEAAGHNLLALAAATVFALLLPALIWAGTRTRLFSARLGPELLALAALCLGALFAGLTWAVVTLDGVARFDAAASASLVPYRFPWLLHVFLWLTTLGTGAALAGMAVTATGFLWAHRRGGLIVPLWVTFAGAQASTWIGKYTVGRARPMFLDGLASALSPSFPSAHASGAAATLGFLTYAVTRDLDPRRGREVAYWTTTLVALVGFSRVFLGVHFATDVVGGFLVGGFWLLVGIVLAEWLERRRRSKLGETSSAR